MSNIDLSRPIEINREFLGNLNCHDQGLTLVPLCELLTSGQIKAYRILHNGKWKVAFADVIQNSRQRADELIQAEGLKLTESIAAQYVAINGKAKAPANTDVAGWKIIASAYLVANNFVYLVRDPDGRLLHRLTSTFLNEKFKVMGGAAC